MVGLQWLVAAVSVAVLIIPPLVSRQRTPPTRTRWDVLFVTDKDHLSRHPTSFEWTAGITVATLTFDPIKQKFSLQLNETLPISSHISYANRSMELSALEFFRGHLMAFCDRSGIQFYLDLYRRHAYVKTMMRTGDGLQVTPFKTEWAAVKDSILYVGGTGKEWTNPDGSILNEHMKWVKLIDERGRISNVNWKFVYDKLRVASNTSYPGYIVHEAVNFDHRRRQWVFLPRRMSTMPYSDAVDVRMGANTIFLVSEDFQHVEMRRVGPLEPDWGFSCIKPIVFTDHPDLPDYYLGLKSRELMNDEGEMTHEGSKLVVFDLDGNIYSELQSLHAVDKYEGIAFLPDNLSFLELLDWQKTHAFGAYPSTLFPGEDL